MVYSGPFGADGYFDVSHVDYELDYIALSTTLHAPAGTYESAVLATASIRAPS